MRPSSIHRASLTALALCMALGACAGGGGGSGALRSSSASLGPEELAADAAQDLYTVIQRRRPRWLQNRGPATLQGRQPTAVIVDGVRQQGDLAVLRTFRAGDCERVSFLNARDATTRYGTDMTAGAIIVVTRH